MPLGDSEDAALVGGKAATLSRLLRHGWPVPRGICLTTALYTDSLTAIGLPPAEAWGTAIVASEPERTRLLNAYQLRIRSATIPQSLVTAWLATVPHSPPHDSGASRLWAVRSSATVEDGVHRSFAGLYTTVLGAREEAVVTAILDCWSSLWSTTTVAYYTAPPPGQAAPAMAVLIQPVLKARAAGVAYSRHPLTGEPAQVLVNAVPGLASTLVSGHIRPDSFVIHVAEDGQRARILQREIVVKPVATIHDESGLRDIALEETARSGASLSEGALHTLAILAKRVERMLGYPVDIEWADDGARLWLLQARPITTLRDPTGPSDATSTWSRANYKETLPELPSPMGLSFLKQFMEANILRHYRRLGCRFSSDLSPVRVIEGRPYINVSLFQVLITQLAGDPTLIGEQLGGPMSALPAARRLPWWALIRAGILVTHAMRQAAKEAPRWFAAMKQMATITAAEDMTALPPAEILERVNRVGHQLQEHDLTFAIVSGVSQGFHALRQLLMRRMGLEWRPAVNAALQGLGTVVSAEHIFRLVKLAQIARADERVVGFFRQEPWAPCRYREALTHTTFLHHFDEYLDAYGHRAVGESDVMSPRFAEAPEAPLTIIRSHLLASSGPSIAEIRRQQTATRTAALLGIDAAFGWRWHERLLFEWWYRRLRRYLELREANRHHLMYVAAALRRLLLVLGDQLAATGTLAARDDVFFLTMEELPAVASGRAQEWRSVVADRQRQRARQAAHPVPDVVGCGDPIEEGPSPTGTMAREHGLSLSAGYAEGPACLIRTSADFGKVRRGDILVVSVLDPGMAPLFGLAAGVIAEMGGVLSHGAIIAREYGIPAVTNVPHLFQRITDGDRVAVDGARGQVRTGPP